MTRRVGALLLLALPSAACGAGSAMRAGIATYETGNYNRAAVHCAELAEHADELSEKAHVRYLVYCGLTHYRLGHRAEAQRLLALGSGEYTFGKSRWLKPSIVDQMNKALDDLEGRSPPVPREPKSVLSGSPEDEPEAPENL